MRRRERVNTNNNVTADNDKLHKIREICDMLRQSFQKVFYPFENLCIDESLLLYNGRLSFVLLS